MSAFVVRLGSVSEPVVRSRGSVAAALLLELLDAELDRWQAAQGPATPLRIVDLGGGTGGLAAEFAGRGHAVRVVDPSPDALASVQQRALDAGLTSLTATQGDATDVAQLLGDNSADMVICHRVLEFVDDPAGALSAIATILRPGGLLSLSVAQRPAAVLGQALAGNLPAARSLLFDPRRFDRPWVIDLVTGAGFAVGAVHGLGAISGLVHESVLRGSASAWTDLLDLEREVSTRRDFQPLAPYLHITALAG